MFEFEPTKQAQFCNRTTMKNDRIDLILFVLLSLLDQTRMICFCNVRIKFVERFRINMNSALSVFCMLIFFFLVV